MGIATANLLSADMNGISTVDTGSSEDEAGSSSDGGGSSNGHATASSVLPEDHPFARCVAV